MKLFKNESLIEVSENHNPGVSNAFIYGGFFTGFFSLIFDLIKAFLPIYQYVKEFGYDGPELALVLCAPVLGHAFSIFHHFNGGMSITASFGALLAIYGYHRLVIILALLFIFALLLPGLDNSIRTIIAFGGLALVTFILFLYSVLPLNLLFGICIISATVCRKIWPQARSSIEYEAIDNRR